MTDCSCYQQDSRFEHGLTKGLSNQLNTFNNFQKLPCITYLIQDQKEWPNVLLPLPPSSQHFRPRMIKDEQFFFLSSLDSASKNMNDDPFFFLSSFFFSISLLLTFYFVIHPMMHQQNMSMTCFAHHTLSTLFVMAGHY